MCRQPHAKRRIAVAFPVEPDASFSDGLGESQRKQQFLPSGIHGYRVFRNAISAALSSGERSRPNSWPLTARVLVKGGPFQPVGT